MKYRHLIAIFAALALASCATDADFANTPNPLTEPGAKGASNFDFYSNQGRFAPNSEQRRAIGLYGH